MPVLTGHSETADGAKTRIDLAFSTAMKAGTGKIYVTDGGLQTVIDPATGTPVTRVAGASHTIEINVSDLHFSGTHVYTDALELQPGHRYSILFEPGALSSAAGPAFSGWIRPGQTQFTTPNVAPSVETPKFADMLLLNDLGQQDNDFLTSGANQHLEGSITGKLAPGQAFELLIGGLPAASEFLAVNEVTEGSSHGYVWTYDGPLPEGETRVTARIMSGDTVLDEDHLDITVDRTRPAVGSSPDGETAFGLDSPVVITFSERVYWTETEGTGDQLQLRDGDNVTYIPMSSVSLSDGGTKLTIPATALHLAAGTDYRVYLPGTMRDVAGNAFGEYGIGFHTAAAADTVAPVALAAPVLDVDSDNGLSDHDGITTDNTPTFGGSGAEAFASIHLFSGSERIGEATADADGKWTITSKPLTTEGIHWVTATQIDQAGNESPVSPAFKLTIDGSAPTLAPYSSTIPTDGTFLLTFSDLIYIAGSLGEVDLYRNDTLFKTIKPGDAQWVVETDGTFEHTVLKLAGLPDGFYRLDFEYSSPVNLVGISAPYLLQTDITFEVGGTWPASLAAPLLDAASDSGLAGDAITSSAVIHGSGAQGGATITLYNVSGSDTLGTAHADASGNWTFTMDGDQFQGSYSVTATQKDGAGNESAKSPALSLTIDSHVNAPSQPLLNLGDATTIDGLVHTADTTPSLTGSGCEAGAKIELFDGTTLLASATAGSDGAWSITTGTLAGGVHHFAVAQTDVAGNASGQSAVTDLAIDVPPPAKLAAPVLAAASDSGSSDSDRITKVTTPTFTGTGAAANTTIKLYDGDTVVGQGTSNPDGTWSVAVDSDHVLIDGVHAISATQVNASGNASPRSDAVNVTIDTIAPTLAGFTSTVTLGHQFEIWFSEPVQHGNFGGVDAASAVIGGILFSMPLSSSNWTDIETRDGHPTSIWHFVPNDSGWVEVALTGVQDAAGNVATIPLGHYSFTVPLF
jgi:hypothetical protein